jgi:hypothetical protein
MRQYWIVSILLFCFASPAWADVGIFDVVVASGEEYAINDHCWSTEGCLQPGALVYRDRGYEYRTIPQAYLGASFIQTFNNDKARTEPDFLMFRIETPAEVGVVFDQRTGKIPAWLASWTNTGITVVNSDTAMTLYTKTFPVGPVVLGGNEMLGHSMYAVFLRPLTDPDTTPPGAPTGLQIVQ